MAELGLQPARRIEWLGWLVAAVADTSIILFTTRWGAALGDDSYGYIKPVRDLLAGRGFSLDGGFPPFLLLPLVVLGLFHLDPLVAIRLLNAGLFGVNAVLFGLLVGRLTFSKAFGWLGTLLVLISEPLIEAHSWAMSDPLFMSLLLITLISFSQYQSGHRRLWLWGAGLAAGLATLTRYAGFFLVGTLVVWLILDNEQPLRARLMDALKFAAMGLGPVFVFVLGILLFVGKPDGYGSFAWEAYTSARLAASLFNVLTLFIPGRFVRGHEFLLGSIILLVMIVGGLVAWTGSGQPFGRWATGSGRGRMLRVLLSLIIVYMAMLYVTHGLWGNADTFNSRYLAPAYLLMLATILVWLGGLREGGTRPWRLLVLGLILMLVASSGYRAIDTIRRLYENGDGYASARWHTSETIAFLKNHPEVPVVSTARAGVYFWTGRMPQSISFPGGLDALHAYLRAHAAYLVVIDSMPPEMYGIPSDKLLSGLTLVRRFSEGAVYAAAP